MKRAMRLFSNDGYETIARISPVLGSEITTLEIGSTRKCSNSFSHRRGFRGFLQAGINGQTTLLRHGSEGVPVTIPDHRIFLYHTPACPADIGKEPPHRRNRPYRLNKAALHGLQSSIGLKSDNG
jgi:hypothetical protein